LHEDVDLCEIEEAASHGEASETMHSMELFVSSSSPPVAQILRRRRSRREWFSIRTDRGELWGYAAVLCPRLVAPPAG
jgi:hypothetical protein